jgi:ABC-type enterochelin transport system permease subunit
MLFVFQDVPIAPVIDWSQFAAVALNAFVALVGVPVFRYLFQVFKTKYEWLVPLVAMVLPGLLVTAASFVSGLLGYPIDFGPLIDVIRNSAIGGALAVALHQVYKQANK